MVRRLRTIAKWDFRTVNRNVISMSWSSGLHALLFLRGRRRERDAEEGQNFQNPHKKKRTFSHTFHFFWDPTSRMNRSILWQTFTSKTNQ